MALISQRAVQGDRGVEVRLAKSVSCYVWLSLSRPSGMRARRSVLDTFVTANMERIVSAAIYIYVSIAFVAISIVSLVIFIASKTILSALCSCRAICSDS